MSHPAEIEPPTFKFSVVRAHKDPLSRLVHEAVRISSVGTLNSKSVWGGPRLSVEKSVWEVRKQITEIDNLDKNEVSKVNILRERVIANAKHLIHEIRSKKTE